MMAASSLLQKFNEALEAQADHAIAFQEFSSALRQTDVQEWTTVVQKWEADHSQPNPYEVKNKSEYS